MKLKYIDKETYNIFVILLLLQLVAYFTFMRTPIFSGDDWNFAYDGYAQLEGGIRLGRWLNVVIWMLLDRHSFAPILSHIVAFSLFAVSGILLAKIWGAKDRSIVFIIAALLCVFPFNSDVISFHIRHFTTTTGLLLSVIGCYYLVNAHKNRLYFIISCVFFVLSYAIYQPYISISLAILLVYAIKMMASGDSAEETIKTTMLQLVCVGVSVIFYFITYKISLQITGLDGGSGNKYYSISNGNIDSALELKNNLIHATTLAIDFFSNRTPFFPLITKQIFLGFCMLFIFMLAIRRSVKLKEKLFICIFLICLVCIPWLVPLIRNVFVVRASMLFSYAILFSGAFYLAWFMFENIMMKKVIGMLGLFIVVIFMFQMSKTGYYREMQWVFDNNLASRVMSRIENNNLIKEFENKRAVPLYVAGKVHKWHRPFVDDKHKGLFTNISRCGVSNCQVFRYARLLNLHSATKNFVYVNNKNRLNMDKIKNMPIWPEVGSVDIIDKVVVVNFGNSITKVRSVKVGW